MNFELDLRVRLAAFDWLRAEMDRQGDDVLPRTLLSEGLRVDGQRVPLVGPQGIFKPRLCELPLSITTAPNGPYLDRVEDDVLRYAYRGRDIQHPDNVGLRTAMMRRTPLIYFHGVSRGKYVASMPVYVIEDNPAALEFGVQVDDRLNLGAASGDDRVAEDRDAARRGYVTATVLRRLHQRSFRERVLRAYQGQCSLCRLRHHELLDAAHIVADADDQGDPIVTNALALCKLHHAAFDRYFIAVRPDYIIEVRRSILDEQDGPMLVHGLKEMHGATIGLPRSPAQHPDPKRLEWRYDRFRQVS